MKKTHHAKIFALMLAASINTATPNAIAAPQTTVGEIFMQENPFTELSYNAKSKAEYQSISAKKALFDACRNGTLYVYHMAKAFEVYIEDELPITEQDIKASVKNLVGNDLEYPFVAAQVALSPEFKIYQEAIELGLKHQTDEEGANQLGIQFWDRCQKEHDHKAFYQKQSTD